jgi:hypothetical protein
MPLERSDPFYGGFKSIEFTNQSLTSLATKLTQLQLALKQDWYIGHVADFCSAEGGGAILASFLEQIAITMLHHHPDFASICCVSGLANAGSTTTMYDPKSDLTGGLQLVCVERSQCISVNAKRAWNQTGDGNVHGTNVLVHAKREDPMRAAENPVRRASVGRLKRWKSMASPVKDSSNLTIEAG